ncbi:Protein kinase-like domain [Pseudocohnilembus persalinus]|uniref:Protein kinase-like domain n=1 Tax=Pseudocohnilembus persalinus TaxID=266149 RepID=A0A0V0R940_PSEPJ|nr:Protein kinase-like domain [Pseudocohnilembus persalinus]|eukprot:KRX11020.1 Protein kinase-like domain [Pseudocohnilembus persalinus]
MDDQTQSKQAFYQVIKVVGDGSFGVVSKAVNTQTGEMVAIKQMKQDYENWDECLKLRELKALQKLKNHINIIKLKEIVQVEKKLNFITEYVQQNIWDYYNDQKKTGRPLSHDTIKSIFYQLCSAIKYMHQHGFFHRDLKPENILISAEGIVKIIDFGLAREIRSRPPYTDYVSTRWYRAPELLIRSTNYNSPVDIFAIGCIMAELFEGQPLFKGQSEIDQISKICGILGTPTKEDWNDGLIQANKQGLKLQGFDPIPLDQVLQNTPYDAIQIIQECLRWDPSKRPSISKILQHPYFKDVEKVLPWQVLEFDKNKTIPSKPKMSQEEIQKQIQQLEIQDDNNKNNNNNFNTNNNQSQKNQKQNQMQQIVSIEKKDSLNLDELEDMLNDNHNKEAESGKKVGSSNFGKNNHFIGKSSSDNHQQDI